MPFIPAYLKYSCFVFLGLDFPGHFCVLNVNVTGEDLFIPGSFDCMFDISFMSCQLIQIVIMLYLARLFLSHGGLNKQRYIIICCQTFQH